MKRVLVRSVAAVAATVLVGVLAACSSGSSTAPATQGATTGATGADTGPLKVWVMGDVGPAFQKATADFTTQTGIGIQVDAIPWENVNDKLTTAVASGQGPDVVQVGLSLLPTFAAAGALKDLSSVIGNYPGLAPANFPDAVDPKNLGSDGKVLSLPWISDTRVLFYRSDILTAAGFSTPPTTWDQMEQVAKALKARGDGQYGYYIPLWDNTLPVQYAWQAGGDVVGADGKVNFDTPEFAAAVDHYLSFFADGSAPTASDWDQTQGFVSGATPMVVSGPYLAKAISQAAPELAGKWSVALSPKDKNGTSLFAGSNLGVWKTSTHVDAAMQLIDYLDKPATQTAWYKAQGELPTNLKALDELSKTGDAALAVYAKQLTEARTVPMVPGWDLIANEMATALTAIGTTGADRGTTLKAFYAKAAQISSNY
ncbi:MAG: extracellular solute-binding protein [Phycicoccus sp.]|nr:extracellular solute-binding protein [Phycicoccus sp.]NMM34721.1 extracellular solute-binding protein [Phycicoccus sp.]